VTAGQSLRRVRFAGTGSFAPARRVTNADLEKVVETNDQWIVERTGIRERRYASREEPTSLLAAEAGRRALEAAGLKPDDVDHIVVATSSPTRIIPPTATYVQKRLGCMNASACDLVAACSGFVYAVANATALIAAGRSRATLVIGAEELSKIMNMKDRNTCVIFGDGAGAVVLTPTDSDSDVLYAKLGADGRLDELIIDWDYGAVDEAQVPHDPVRNTIQMKGREVYRFAVPKFVENIHEALDACRLKLDDIKLFIPHQMNARMIEAVAERLNFPMSRVFVNIQHYGNTSAASIPIALDEALRTDRIARGDVLLFSAMGAGLTWGTMIVRW